MLQKNLKIEIKSVNEEGSFTGYAAVFNNVDLGGDIIAPGAFAKTIQEKSDHPVLWGHMTREVIGVNKKYTEDEKGLFVEGQLVLDVQRARETYALMKAGAVKGMSIGYDAVREEWNNETYTRTLKEIKLWEYSFTPFPMNPEAQVTGVKSFADCEQDLIRICDFLKAHKGKLSAEQLALIEQTAQTLSTLHAAQAPGAVMHDNAAPDLIHSALRCDAITDLLKGVM